MQKVVIAQTPSAAARQMIRRRDAALAALARLTDATCHELARRARGAPSDGFPTGGSGVAVSTSDISRPTEMAAFRGLPDDPDTPDDWSCRSYADPVGNAIADILELMTAVEKQALTLDRKRQYVLATGDERRGRINTIGSCMACSRAVACNVTDRLRSGFCSACYCAFIRADRPDRAQFIRERRESDAVVAEVG